jgi:erythromycin esterase
MKKTLLAFVLISLFTSAIIIENDKVEWLKKNAIPISIDPLNEDFADLQKMKALIGESNIVMLGEQTHGDGATIEAKCRLIKFLHKEMGFDVLAFESSFYGCDKANYQILKGDTDAKIALDYGIFALWSSAREFESLPQYINSVSKSNHPLEVCGFDSQISSKYGNTFYWLLRQFIKKKAIAIDAQDTIMLGSFLYPPKGRRITEENTGIDSIEKFKQSYNHLINAIGDKEYENKFWQQCLKTHCGQIVEKSKPQEKQSNPLFRDSLMADNFIWLAKNKYPNRKIIIWAASFHNVRNSVDIVPVKGENTFLKYPNFGSIISQHFGNEKMYNIGFSAAQGYWAWCNSKDSTQLPPMSDNSFEDLAVKANLDNAFIDFKNLAKNNPKHWLNDSLSMRLLSVEFQRSIWNRHIDGLCFTKTSKRVHNREKK